MKRHGIFIFSLALVALLYNGSMARTLTNFPGTQVPDLTDAQPTAAGQIAGKIGGGDLAEAIDLHNHTAGKGLPVPFSGLAPDGDLDADGNGIIGVDYLTLVDQSSGAVIPVESVGLLNGLLVYRDSSNQLRSLIAPAAGKFIDGWAITGTWSVNPSGQRTTANSGVLWAHGPGIVEGWTIDTWTVAARAQDATTKVDLLVGSTVIASLAEFSSIAVTPKSVAVAGSVLTSADAPWMRITTGGGETSAIFDYWELSWASA